MPIVTRGLKDSAVTSAKIAAGTVVASDIADGGVGAAKLTTNLKKGFIPLPLAQARILASDATTNIAIASGNGGQLALDTAPVFERVSTSTDIQFRLRWVSSNSAEIQWQFMYPPDLDDTAAVTVNLLANMAGTTDTPVIAVKYFEGVGDTDAGGNTAALSTTVAQKTVTIAAGDIGAYPKTASVALVVGAHTTDAAHLYAAWIEYTRKD